MKSELFINELLPKIAEAAQKNFQSVMTSETLLYVLVHQAEVQKLLATQSISHKEIKDKLVEFFRDNAEPTKPLMADLTTSEDLVKIFRLAILRSKSNGKNTLNYTDLLVCYTEDDDLLDDTYSKTILNYYNIDRLDLLSAISHPSEAQETTSGFDAGESIEDSDGPKVKKNVQPDFLINLNKKADEGKIDSLTGRADEILRMTQVLIRRRKNNPVLVGEPGTGKTAIVEGLALKITKGEAHPKLDGYTIFSLDLGILMAGTKFRGDVEQKFTLMIKFLKNHPKSILYVDETHMIIGAGATSDGSMDMSNMLKPMMANGEIKLIGSTTFKEYKKIEKDAAFARRLQKIDVVEPSIEDTIQILSNLKGELAKHHAVGYTDEAIKLSVNLSVKYINDKFLPDKAIDVLDEAGAYAVLANLTEVNKDVVEKVISKMARIPEKTLNTSEKDKMKNLSSNLKMLIYGQDEAIDQVTEIVELSKAGLRSATKPIGNFLFAGTTGVGKTELAKQLADQLGMKLLRLDMSEYDKEHSSEKLIGSPPGYVGHGEGGILTNFVTRNPHSVILFDELEKAHEKCWNYLLQIMDYATLTDSEGKGVDFRNCIILMTSNAGASEIQKKTIALSAASTAEIKARPMAAINSKFTPEFRNRLDKIITFNPLSMDNAMMILNKLLAQVDNMVSEKNILIEYTKASKEWLVNKGYDPIMGARPMERAVDDYVKKPLSKEILYGLMSENNDGGVISIDLKDDKIVMSSRKYPKKKVKTASETETK